MAVDDLRLLVIAPMPPPEAGEGPYPYPVPDFLALTKAIDFMYCEGAPPQVWNAAGCAKVAPLVRKKAHWAEQRGYDAVIIYCMLDPAVEELKRCLSIPVIGAGAASFAIASLLGNRSALIYPGTIPVYDLHKDVRRTWDGLMAAAQRELNNGADVLIPACTELDRYAEGLQEKVGVSVLPCFRIA